jgi:monoamine oxidase
LDALSTKYWDVDERHSFQGDHVIIRQGYMLVVDHILNKLTEYGDKFRCALNFPVGEIKYNRKTTTSGYGGQQDRCRKFVELSDTCRVSSQDKSQSVKCDFVVSAVPLGVLKASLDDDEIDAKLNFSPALPFSKRDAIESVGFGLLNKVYLQFSSAFWRKDNILGTDYTQFGNASGINPQHYMFLDIGQALSQFGEAPPVLMSLISGSEAVASEQMGKAEVVSEVMDTLRNIFSEIDVPDPIAFEVTQWGKDRFARGSYSFLGPGTTDQDFETLQSPVNENGDSLFLEGSETMRLFFAGEHTTAMHPSMAHGAMSK